MFRSFLTDQQQTVQHAWIERVSSYDVQALPKFGFPSVLTYGKTTAYKGVMTFYSTYRKIQIPYLSSSTSLSLLASFQTSRHM